MKVVVAPDSFKGTLTAREAARAIAAGWRRARPDDEVVTVPLSDGGDGLLDAVRRPDDRTHIVEVADPLGRPRTAQWLLRPDGTAVVESAEACGLRLLSPGERNPLRTTTYGVGQLLAAALDAGARRVVVGAGGSATVDGGAGALTALGVRLMREGGAGLKIGGGELVDIARVEPRWLDPRWDEVDVTVWCDVRTLLADAAATFAPQKGAAPDDVAVLAEGLRRWADVVERDLGGSWRDLPGSGAAGGLPFGLLAAVGAHPVAGVEAVAEAVGFSASLAGADLVVTGEGQLDATSGEGKVVGAVTTLAADAGVAAAAVVGRSMVRLAGLADLEEAGGDGQGDAAAAVFVASERLAARWGVPHPQPHDRRGGQG